MQKSKTPKKSFSWPKADPGAPRRSLFFSEWALCLFGLSFILCTVIISRATSYRALRHLQIKKAEPISIEISGSVKRPGSLLVEVGTPVEEILRKVRPLPQADLEQILCDNQPIGGEKYLDAPCHLHIPELKTILVTVSGAVEKEVVLHLPLGSRISDLKSLVEVSQEADLAFFRRRKLLKNKEALVVPKRKNKA